MSGRGQAARLTNEAGLPVHVDVRRPAREGPAPVVVALHGFKGFKDWGFWPPSCRFLAERGIATVAMNSSLNGVEEQWEEFTALERFARNTPRREVRDVRLVLDAITDGALGPGLDPERIGLLGHSRGGGVATLVAAGDPRVRSLVTWAAVSTFQRYTERAVAAWRRDGRIDVPNARTGQTMWLDVSVLEDLEKSAEEYDLRHAMNRVTVPTLVIHGERDEAVSAESAEELHEWCAAARKELRIIPRTGHTFGAEHPWKGAPAAWEAVIAATADWFAETLGA